MRKYLTRISLCVCIGFILGALSSNEYAELTFLFYLQQHNRLIWQLWFWCWICLYHRLNFEWVFASTPGEFRNEMKFGAVMRCHRIELSWIKSRSNSNGVRSVTQCLSFVRASKTVFFYNVPHLMKFNNFFFVCKIVFFPLWNGFDDKIQTIIRSVVWLWSDSFLFDSSTC